MEQHVLCSDTFGASSSQLLTLFQTMASESDPFTPPYGKPGFDINGDQRGRIVDTCVAIIVITTTFVFLRLLSRKLSKAALWVRVECLLCVSGSHY